MPLAWLAAALLALAGSFVHAAEGDLVPVPPLAARVTDLTATLSTQQVQALEAKLAAWEARRGAQLAVLLVPTTQPEAIEQFSIRVAEAWKVGRKGVDDGALLVVAKNDKRLRIEVGRGFEGSLTDVTAKRIIAEVMAPRFSAGDFAGGIEAGVDRIIAVTEGEALPPPPATGARGGGSASGLEGFLAGGLMVLLVVGSLLRAIFGALVGGLVGGALAGGLMWLITGSAFAAVAGALIAFVFIAAARGSGLSRSAGRHGGGWGGGLGGGGGWGGGSGGGWSGGGGTFSGGGASGSWK